MSDFLMQMAASSAQRARDAKQRESPAELRRRAAATAAPPTLRLSSSGFDVIAELKLRSPAAGQLASPTADWRTRITAYANGGAAAVSVLTEPTRFDGSLAHLQTAAEALKHLQIPVMRKDFLCDPYQVLEARAAGAGGVLLILRMLKTARTADLLETALENGMFVLLEAFDARDLECAAELMATPRGAATILIGINGRDLATLNVAQERLTQLAGSLPADRPCVAESGIATPEQALAMRRHGYRLALIGSALMRSNDPERLLGEILSAARSGGR